MNNPQRDPWRYDSPNSSFHYRKAREDAAQRRLRGMVIAGAIAVVLVAVAFGVLAVMQSGKASDVQSDDGQFSRSALADAQKPVEAATGQAAAGSSAAAQGDEDLAARAAEFAVDPNRTDWNFSTNGKKTVYLTIDDGPSEMTQQVLDILDRYNCKATFFVVGHNEEYFPMIAEAFRRGHTIGLHSMSHDYAYVYSSVDAFYADLGEIGEVVKEQIGFVPCFIRFPGGSSNEISASYSSGIMTTLTQSVQENGYQYYDWNLSVGDGSEHTTEEIIGYGTADEGSENIMLLCHDSATKQTTVDALPSIIEHYQSLGYTFEAIDRASWVCHHGVNN